jgi:Fe2+ or Zn2+ uptake regulation protein
VRSPAELTNAFRGQGLKVTPQRQLLFRLLHGDRSHPSAEALFHRAEIEMPGISLRTVYQTLTDLAGMGEIDAIDLGTGTLRFDPNTESHDHVVCAACGTIIDVHGTGSPRLPPAAVPPGFRVETTQVVFRGTCASCIPGGRGAESHHHPSNQRSRHA